MSSRVRQQGVTLVELMVTVSVLAILLTVGVPSLTGFVQRSEVDSVARQLADGLKYARSEAVNLQRDVSVCPLNVNNNGCGNDWALGLLLYEDNAGGAGFDAGTADTVVKTIDIHTTTTVTKTRPAISIFRFDSFGRIGGNNATFTVTAGNISEQIAMANSGRIRMQ